MTSQEISFKDIFQGSEKIELFGKLPSFIWGFSDAARKFMADFAENRGNSDKSLADAKKLLSMLDAIAGHIENTELQARITETNLLLDNLQSGKVTNLDFNQSFTTNIEQLEKLAGGNRESFAPDILEKMLSDREMEKADRVKTGRSADIVISREVLEDIHQYLASEILTEGISAVLVIDNAGTLIINIGNRLDLDVIGLSAVAAANFAATEQIARIIGERDFVLLFYKGHSESFHFCRVGPDYIIVTIFSNNLSLGLLRLKIGEVTKILEQKLPKRQG